MFGLAYGGFLKVRNCIADHHTWLELVFSKALCILRGTDSMIEMIEFENVSC
jgi:hypothetical protein